MLNQKRNPYSQRYLHPLKMREKKKEEFSVLSIFSWIAIPIP
jgi:hypothetical protein